MPLFSNKSLSISAIILGFFILFLWILGENASIRVHDNLDANIAWYKSLVDQNLLFANSYAPNETVMQAPRIAFGSEWSLVAWFYVWFKPMFAYNLNLSIMCLIAFIGSYLFTTKTLKLSPKIAPIIALAFAFLPFLFAAGISVAGQPLLFWSFGEILKTDKNNWLKHAKKHWLLAILFPFYSMFIISGLFTMTLMLGYLLYNFRKNESKINLKAGLFFLVLLTISYVFVEYRLFLDILMPSKRNAAHFISHRVEFVQGNTLMECLKVTKNSFLTGQNHFQSLHTYLILPTVFVYLIYWFTNKNLTRIGGPTQPLFKKGEGSKKLMVCVILIIALISVLDGFWNYTGFEQIKDKIGILKIIQFDRFYSLYPILWVIVFVLIIKELSAKIGIALAVVQVLIVLFSNQAINDFAKKILFKKDYISYREFYAEDLFSEVKKVLNQDKNTKSKVGMIGLHPAMAQYNEIPTIDGYVVLYSLEYKHKVQAIIQGELNQNKFIKTYFEQWGSRCYLFDNEAVTSGNGVTKNQKCCTDSLAFDFVKLKQMNCNYLLSAVEVKHLAPQMKLLSKVEDANWRIWIYGIQ